MKRCWWCEGDDLYTKYHDEVWGQKEERDQKLFEMLSLEAFQAGLSWITILRKQENFEKAFAGWDIEKIANFGEADFERLMADAGIVRNRAKISATINNASKALDLIAEHGRLYDYFVQFTPKNRAVPKGGFERGSLPLMVDEAKTMSKALKKKGFRFTGPMTCMSFMQATGFLNDHVKGCHLCIY